MKKTKSKKPPQFSFRFRDSKIRVILDKVLIFRLIQRLHGRFWGVAGILIMLTGFGICFLIRPELLDWSTAFSDFGSDVRTAPYFAGSVFLCAYGLWRWHNYLARTWKRTMPVTGLIMLTVVGLYLVALFPVAWKPWPYRVHLFGVILAGVSILATVLLDGVLSKTKSTPHVARWRSVRMLSFVLIIGGGYLTFGSAEIVEWFYLSLPGELMIIGGYFLWICVKTFQGEGNRTILAKILNKIVLVS
jgi:hypothetical protein